MPRITSGLIYEFVLFANESWLAQVSARIVLPGSTRKPRKPFASSYYLARLVHLALYHAIAGS